MEQSKVRAFHIVDVFAGEKYAGNQLAVVRNAYDFSDENMQKFAREMNFSETTFVLVNESEMNASESVFRVRIFTPKLELPFAGHPTIGTAFVIQQYIIRREVPKIILDLNIGPIEVTPVYESGRIKLLWMKQNEPKFSKGKIGADQVSKSLGLKKTDIDPKFPIQEVSTGVPFIIIPLKSMRVLKGCRVDKDRYFALIRRTKAKSLLVFCPGSHGTDSKLSVRMFSDYYGVSEDPATGSANGCLAAYLSHHEYFGSGLVDIKVDQGYEICRPSTIHLRTAPEKSRVNVSVGGQVVPVAEGVLV